jgi:general secretion pathway protein A
MSGLNDKHPTQEQIAKRAFEIYVQRGCENGTERDNWMAAEEELLQLSRAPGQHQVLHYSGYQPNHEPTSMLLDFFGLREQPFGMTPDPAYLYASDTHRDALSALKFGVIENRGFFALIAQPGMGKTTLLYRLLEDLHDGARTVLVSQTQCNSRELIAYILHELGVESEGMGLVTMHGKLNEILFNHLLAGKRFVLVVDEAQNLDDAVLETVRMLSNFETHNAKLVQIILAGQPRLASKLAQPRLIQLRQRIAVVSHLEPFTAKETASYIAHRLTVAGHSGEPIFDSGALDEIARQSDGIPRNINNICFNSMLAAFYRGQRIVNAETVHKAAASLDLEALISKPATVVEPVAPQPAPPVSAAEIVSVPVPQKSALVQTPSVAVSAIASIPPAAPQKVVSVEPPMAQPPTLANSVAPDAGPVPDILSPQATATEPAPILVVNPPKIVNPESAIPPAPAAVISVQDEVADGFVAPAQAIAAPEPAHAPVAAAAGQAIPVVRAASAAAAAPVVAVSHAAAVPIAQLASAPPPVPAVAPAHASASPFKPLPRSAQTPVTVPPKTNRSATEFISYEDYKKRSLKRWQVRSVIVTAILLSAILALAILGRSQSRRGITPHSLESTSGSIGPVGDVISSENGTSNYDAAPVETNDGVILTVAASANQSIRDLSLRYMGHFDSKLSKQILLLNPDLKNSDHLQDGQLIRIPLPAGALKKTNDTGHAASTDGSSDDAVGLLGKIDALLHGQ